jgi:hypothetical protein
MPFGGEALRMISSWRGIAVATATAVLIAIVLVVDVNRTPVAANRALVPGFEPERVTQLVWERAGAPAIDVVRAPGSWQVRSPSMASSTAPADSAAISDVLAALRGARWHRRGEPTPTHAALTIVSPSGRRTLRIGEPIAGTDQVWIVDGDRGLVVDSWVARSLDRDLLSLRIRTPLADAHAAHAIVIESASESAAKQPGATDRIALRLEGTPRRLVRPVQLLIAVDIADELERALGELTIVRLPAKPVIASGLAITIAGSGASSGSSPSSAVTIEIGGSCPGFPELIAISGTAGEGCIERAAATSIEQAIARLRRPPEEVVDRRPLGFEPHRIVLVDGIALDVSRLRVGDHPADQARVAELIAALAAPAEVIAPPAKPATQQLVIEHARATTTLDVYSERVVARHGEPVALRPAPGAWQLLTRPSRELRDVTLWLEEPTTITTVRIDAVAYERAAVIGEWTRHPNGRIDARRIEELVALLAAPRAIGFGDGPLAVKHRVLIAITPPAGSATQRVLEIGTDRRGRCAARLGHEIVLLSPTVCVQIAALAK